VLENINAGLGINNDWSFLWPWSIQQGWNAVSNFVPYITFCWLVVWCRATTLKGSMLGLQHRHVFLNTDPSILFVWSSMQNSPIPNLKSTIKIPFWFRIILPKDLKWWYSASQIACYEIVHRGVIAGPGYSSLAPVNLWIIEPIIKKIYPLNLLDIGVLFQACICFLCTKRQELGVVTLIAFSKSQKCLLGLFGGVASQILISGDVLLVRSLLSCHTSWEGHPHPWGHQDVEDA
jgi:hypothetical protein